MAIGIDELDDEEVVMNEPSQEPLQLAPQLEEDFIADFLKTRGIDDTSRIRFSDDDGNIEERDWNSLSKEEKFNILNTPLESQPLVQENNELSDEEIQFINMLRENNMSPNQYLEQITPQPQEPTYKIDDLSDDELFLLDLESRTGEITEDLAAQALSAAKQNEELFLKQVDGIRKEYKEREDLQLQQEQAEIEQQQQEAYNQFLDSVIDSINNFDSIGNLDLNFEDLDKEMLASFMLSRDEAGNNYLWQALQDPDNLVKAAWFILNGEEALNNISDYFINLIKLVSENQYKKGFQEGQSGTKPSRPEVVISLSRPNQLRKLIKDIDEFDDD